MTKSLINTTVYLGLALSSVIPTIVAPSQVTPSYAQTTETIIYVDPNSGNDQTGNGKRERPFQTLTQAIAIAPRNAVIQLASGTYSEQTGETFPIIVEKPLEIRGEPRNQGYNVKIEGGGEFYSRTGAGQNVGIVFLASGTLTGVSVTNLRDRGTGVWVEDASPVIRQNTFRRNDNTGVSVNGSGQPTISDNYFYSNGGNGMVIYGKTQPLVKNNTFERTGFGISITENAQPQIIDNEIKNNRIGVIAEGNSLPTLQNNLIERSQEDGLVAITNAHPNLGTARNPGNNTFQGNREQDINNLTENIIPAYGNQIRGKIAGKIDQSSSAVAATIATDNVPRRVNAPTPSLSQERNESPPRQEQVWTAPNSSFSPIPPLGSSPLSPPEENVNPPINNNNAQLTLPPVNRSDSNSPRLRELLVLEQNASPRNPNSLPVPSGNIPRGNPFRPGASPEERAAAVGGEYRVVVELVGAGDKRRVKEIVPEAFTSRYQGRAVMQVGIFRSRANAEEIRQRLRQAGLQVRVIPL